MDWREEFNGTTLDLTVWSFDTGAGGWGSGESQYYLPQNAIIKDGLLTTTAKREAMGGAVHLCANTDRWQEHL